jgi:hypothetical protein
MFHSNYRIMKDAFERKIRLPKGAGYLIGFVMGASVAVGFVAITGVEALIGAVAASISFPVGLLLEQKIQGKEVEISPAAKILSVVFLLLGIVFFTIALVYVV